MKNEDGNGAWNRNISYPGNNNLWDSDWHEPVIDLSKLSGTIGNSSISKDSTFTDITNVQNIKPVLQYMVDNYIMDSGKFGICFTGIKGDPNQYNNTIVPGKFNSTTNKFKKNNAQNQNNAVQFKFFLRIKDKDATSAKNESMSNNKPNENFGFWKSLYIINYKDSGSSTK